MFDRKQHIKDMRKLRKMSHEKYNSGTKNRECGKVPYPTKEDALVAASARLKSNTANRTFLRSYLCPKCSQFHLTHQEKKYVRTS